MAANPDRINRFLDRLTELHLSNMEKYLSAVGTYIDLIGFGDDMGMQTGPQFSPEMYREFFKFSSGAILFPPPNSEGDVCREFPLGSKSDWMLTPVCCIKLEK